MSIYLMAGFSNARLCHRLLSLFILDHGAYLLHLLPRVFCGFPPRETTGVISSYEFIAILPSHEPILAEAWGDMPMHRWVRWCG